MNLEKLIAVSGLPGIYRVAVSRANGLILEDLDEGKKQFASARKHQFSPLESIAIFTDDGDSVELKKVFRNMLDQIEDNPPLEGNAKTDELYDYFEDVLPNFDKDRVFPGDIKKVIKWFNFLNNRGLLQQEQSSDEEE